MKASSGLVGRASDRAAIERRFEEEDARLVTLLGPPGIGKTALARAIAAEREAVVVLLDRVEDAAAFADQLAVACGGGGGDAAAMLRDRGERLVVLDAVKPALASEIHALLEQAPEIAVLATARESLGVDSEIVHELGPLDVANGDAVEVLVLAARRAAHGYVPRPEDLPHLVSIARTLEGIPLALEVAGARLPIVGAAVLAREPPSALESIVHQAIAALEPDDRGALAMLTAFRSGFDVTSAAAVLRRDVASTATAIERLRARSLVRIRDAGAGRFDLYQPVRAAAEKAASHVAAEGADHHAEHFVREAEAAAARAHVDPAARAWLVAEREELMAVIQTAMTTPRLQTLEAERALRATLALSSVLFTRGPIGAVLELVSPLVVRTQSSGADPRLSARATALRGAIRRERGDVRAALKDLLAADSIARTCGDQLLEADVVVELGRTVLAAGEIAAARDHFDRAARTYAALGARAPEAHATTLYGATLGVLGDAAVARAMIERAAALASGDRTARAPVLVLLARACAELRDAVSAEAALAEAITIAASEHDVRVQGDALVLRGLLLLDRDVDARDLEGATAALARARDLFSANGHAADAAIARGWLGVAARSRGAAAEAYALLAEARDVCKRSARPAHAVAFGVALALLDQDIGRAAAARAGLDVLATETAIAWEHATAWPPPAKALVDAALGATTTHTLHVRLLAIGRAPKSAAPPPPDSALLVGERGEWFRAPHGERVGLERRKSLALLLDRLAAAPGTSLDAPTLFAAAWPGERALASAAAHRVRVGIATLRKLGLRDLVVTTPTGYSLSADCQLVRV